MELIRQDADLVIRLLHQGTLCTPIVVPKDRPLMVNLPGDAKEAKEALEFILPELKRAIEMLNV